MLSFWGFSLPFFVHRVVFAVPNINFSALTPYVNLDFCGLFDGDVIVAGLVSLLVNIFKARITFLMLGFSLLCCPERLITTNVLISSADWALVVLCMSHLALCIVPSDVVDCGVVIPQFGQNGDAII